MKKSLLLSALAIGLTASTAAYAISVNGTAVAVIKAAITANAGDQMNFGTINAAATAGTVVLSTAGVRSSSLTMYGTSTAGTFSVTAEPSTALTITFPATATLTGTPSGTMTIGSFTHSSVPASDTTDGTGTLALNVGATLNVGANQPSGTYQGTYAVTLSY